MTAKSFLKTMGLIHLALCAGLALFAFFAYTQNGGFEARMDNTDLMVYVVPIVAASGYFMGKYLFQKQVRAIEREAQLSHKLIRYQTALLLQYALLEGPAFLALFIYFSSGNALHLVIALSLMAYLISLRPTRDNLIKALPLKQPEVEQITNNQ